MKKMLLTLLVLLSLTAILSGCVDQEKTADETTLVIAAQWDPKNLDPHEYGYIGQRIGYTETLVGVDHNVKLYPLLAEGWDVSDDELTWIFTLRKGVVFHDSTPFTAEIMKQSLERAIQKTAIFNPIPIVSIKATDTQTLTITLSKPFPPLAAYLSKGESAALSPNSYDANGDVIQPIGTGPFMYESWKPKEEISVIRNPDYYGTVPTIERVTYRIVPEAVTRGLMLRGGDIQSAMILPPHISSGFVGNNDYQVLEQPIPRVRMVAFNTERAPFDDKRVRQAFNYAIDRDAIVNSVLEGVGSPAGGLFPDGFYWANENIKPYTYNPQKAKELLTDAGWVDSNGDGFRERDGTRLKVVFTTYPERAELPPHAEVIQQYLKAIGFDVELKVLNVDASNKLRNDGNFDIFLMGRGLLFIPDPDSIMMTDYHSSGTSGDGWGAYRWQNDRVDALIEEAQVTSDPAKRKALYDEVQAIVVDEAPVAYLNYYVNIDVIRSNIHGYKMHPTEQCFHLENVYIT